MINAYSFTMMVGILLHEEASKTDLLERTGLHHVTIAKYINHMTAKRVVRISGWRRDKGGRRWVPLYSINADGERDEPRPKSLSGAARSKLYRARQRSRKLNQMLAGAAS